MTRRIPGCCGSAALLLLLLALAPDDTTAQPAPVKAPHLYVLLVADTDSNLGPYVVQDRDNMRRILKEGFATRPHRFSLEVLDGSKVTADNVVRYYQGLAGKVRRQEDTLLFYYSGHGATLPDKGGHFLSFTRDTGAGRPGLARAVLRKEMAKLQPRLSVILTDCCSAIPRGSRGAEFKAPPRASWPVLDLLLFQHAGVADINGCQANALSWSYDDKDGVARGGTFTLALAPLLCENKGRFKETFGAEDGFVTWEQFSKRLRQDTDKWYQQVRSAALAVKPVDDIDRREQETIRKQTKQDPQVFSLAKKDERSIPDNVWLFGVEHTNARRDGKPIVLILKVYPDTPAAAAGFQKDDVILAVDGQAVRSREELARALDHSEGKVAIDYLRAGKKGRKTVELKLVKPPAPK